MKHNELTVIEWVENAEQLLANSPSYTNDNNLFEAVNSLCNAIRQLTEEEYKAPQTHHKCLSNEKY